MGRTTIASVKRLPLALADDAIATEPRPLVQRVLFISPELPPWVKSGGLGDVTAALPAALRAAGVDARVLAPGYGAVLDALPHATVVAEIPAHSGLPECRLLTAEGVNGAPVLLIDCPSLFRRPGTAYQDEAFTDWPDNYLRFALLSRIGALLGSAASGLGWRPDVVHCNDWPTGLAPAYLSMAPGEKAASVVAIHNLSHQGVFPPGVLDAVALPRTLFAVEGLEYFGNVSYLKSGIYYADRLVTVSPTYAAEIQTDAGGQGLGGLLRARSDALVGILNGIDTRTWDPGADPHLAHTYDFASIRRKSVNKLALQRRFGLELGEERMLLGVVSRLADQKGIDWLLDVVPDLVSLPVQLVVLGSGDKALEARLTELAVAYPARVAAVIGFDESLAHLIEGGADAFVMPSRYEPCGLNQMYSLRYGTPPIVRATGGLADTVVDCVAARLADGTANGFSYHGSDAHALLATIGRALDAWRKPAVWRALQKRGMAGDFSWAASAQRYLAVYRAACVAQRERT
ncbi:MAG: glycogen synthase GlgA [Casimicrobiaceae bacterium]